MITNDHVMNLSEIQISARIYLAQAQRTISNKCEFTCRLINNLYVACNKYFSKRFSIEDRAGQPLLIGQIFNYNVNVIHEHYVI